MRQRFLHVATLALLILSFTVTRAAAQQNPSALSQQGAQQVPPSHPEPNPEARQVENNIKSALNQDPNHSFSRVRVQNTDSAIILSGVVTSADLKSQAEQIATQNAGGKKVTNHIKVNPNVHPGPGL